MALSADDFVTIIAPGVTIAATGTTSAVTAIPFTLGGTRLPTKIRVTATSAIHFQLGIAGVVATTAGIMVQPGDSTRLRVPLGITSFAVIQDTVGGNVTVSPCEDS